MPRSRKKTLVLAVAAAACVSLVPVVAAAQAMFVRPGVTMSYVIGKSRAFGVGGSLSVDYFYEGINGWPITKPAIGGYADVEYNVQIDGDGNHVYFSAGPEFLPIDMMGIQVGPSYRGKSDNYDSRVGLQLATYGAFTFPFLSPFVGVRVNFPFAGDKSHGWEVALIAALRGSFFVHNQNGCVDQDFSCFLAIDGRPLRLAGRRVTAGSARNSGWTAPLAPVTEGLSAAERRELAAEWKRSALDEHASIAAFGRLSLELIELGAPADLLRAAHRAAADEVEHARLAFALASAYAGEPTGPGPIAGVTAAPSRPVGWAALVRESFLDGCVNEGGAAALARAALRRAGDKAVKQALARIARDEARHATLGWQVIAYGLEAGGAEAREALAAAIAEADSAAPGAVRAVRSGSAALTAHGVLAEAERTQAVQRARKAAVKRARALLSTTAAQWSQLAA